MGAVLHWFLPTNGDSRSDLSLGNAVGVAGSRAAEGGAERAPDIGYIGQIARSAEQLGFTAALTPTSSWCEDAWVMTAGLSQVTERFKFLVAFRPGLLSPTLAAQMAATYQRISRGRLLLNVVTGGDDAEQQRFGDHQGKEARYRRAGEFLHIVRALWTGEPVDFTGEFFDIRGARIVPAPVWPEIYLGGSSQAAIDVAASAADVYLTWGEPPGAVAGKLDRVRERAKAAGRELRFGIRLHVIARESSAEAWAQAQRLLDGLDPAAIERAQAIQRASGSEGQQRMLALHGGRTDALEVRTTDRSDAMTAVDVTAADISPDDFRHAMGHFATGVTVVTSIGPDGQPAGTTASAVSSLSLDPPLVLVCFDRDSLTLEAVRSHGAFAVNVLAAPQRHLSANFARRGMAAAWEGVRHHPGLTGSPRLHGVLAALECTVEHYLPGGDHEIVVGRVHDVETSGNGAAPLLYWRGSYVSLEET